MLKYVNTDIVFQEIPDEVTLAVNLSGCPCKCPGCHSKYLWADSGSVLDEATVERLIDSQKGEVTCLSLMGGDAQPQEVDRMAAWLRKHRPHLRIAWWSGRSFLSPLVNTANFAYIKLGPYLPHLGPLKSERTNQRLYKVVGGRLSDITSVFWRKQAATVSK